MLMRLAEWQGYVLLSVEVEIKGWSSTGVFPIAH